LSHLNLSYNNLSGKIPSGNQLQVLDDQASIYVGNPGLCGPPLTKKCPETNLIPAAPEDQKDGSDNVFLLGMELRICDRAVDSLLQPLVQGEMENCLLHIL